MHQSKAEQERPRDIAKDAMRVTLRRSAASAQKRVTRR